MGWSGKMDLHPTDIISRLILFHQNLKQHATNAPTSHLRPKGKKFGHYRTLESLAEYLLIAQDAVTIDRYVRQPDGRWLLTAYRGLGAVTMIEAIDCELPLTEVYEKVEGLDDGDWGRTLSVLKEDHAAYSV